jgi:hypothetical protein
LDTLANVLPLPRRRRTFRYAVGVRLSLAM